MRQHSPLGCQTTNSASTSVGLRVAGPDEKHQDPNYWLLEKANLISCQPAGQPFQLPTDLVSRLCSSLGSGLPYPLPYLLLIS